MSYDGRERDERDTFGGETDDRPNAEIPQYGSPQGGHMEEMAVRITNMLIRDNCEVDRVASDDHEIQLGVVAGNGGRFFVTVEEV